MQVAVRALLYEDRFLQFEQALFCDKTTEKTVEVTVTDEVARENTYMMSTIGGAPPEKWIKYGRLSDLYSVKSVSNVDREGGRG